MGGDYLGLEQKMDISNRCHFDFRKRLKGAKKCVKIKMKLQVTFLDTSKEERSIENNGISNTPKFQIMVRNSVKSISI